MIYLVLCIILNAFIGSIFKYFDRYGVQNFQAIVINYFVCVIMAGIVSGASPIPSDLLSKDWLPFAIIVGLSLIVVFNLVGATINAVGVGTATVFQKMALIAPTLLAILVYGERTSVMIWIGIACAIVSIYLMSKSSNKNADTSLSKSAWLLPIMTFLGSCFVDTAFYLIDKKGLAPNGDIQFLASLFLIAGFIGVCVIIFRYFRSGESLTLKNVIGGICLGIPNFFSLYLLILSLQAGMAASVVFPVNNVGVLVLAAILGFLLFGERFTKQKYIGFGLAIIAIALITLG